MGLFGKKPKAGAPLLDTPLNGALRPLEFAEPADGPSDERQLRGRRARKIDPAEFAELQSTLAAMQARLAAAEHDRAVIDSRLRALDASTVALTTEHAADAERSAGPVDDTSMHTNAIHELRTQLAWLLRRADAFAIGHEEMRVQLGDLQERDVGAGLEEVRTRVAELAAVTDPEAHRAETKRVAEQLAQLSDRVGAIDGTAREAADSVAALDQRVSNVSTELANQLSELGNDIDQLLASGNPTPDPELVTALKTGQVRLAEEQARYEIAFRQDLATLAEQVRRAGRGT